MTAEARTPTVLEMARRYHARGWAVVPIPYKDKNPGFPGWQNLQLTADELPVRFSGRRNVGALLGEPSGWLVEVDLDHPLAIDLADAYLPTTAAVFGRASKLRSHRAYKVTGPVKTLKRKLPRDEYGDEGGMIIELRSTGCQTVFPGSVHPSGEPIEWESDGEPAEVDPDVLAAAVNAIADEVLRKLGLEPPPPVTESRAPRCQSRPSNVIERARRHRQDGASDRVSGRPRSHSYRGVQTRARVRSDARRGIPADQGMERHVSAAVDRQGIVAQAARRGQEAR